MSATVTLIGEWSGRETFEVKEEELPGTMTLVASGDKRYTVKVSNSDEYKILSISLRYLSKEEVTYTREKQVLQLRAACMHLPKLKEQAIHMILEQLLGHLTPQQLREIFLAATNLDISVVRAYCLGLFVEYGEKINGDDLFEESYAALVNDLIDLNKREVESRLESERRTFQYKILSLKERIQARELAQSNEKAADDTPHITEAWRQLDEAKSLVTFLSEADHQADGVDCGELPMADTSGIGEIKRTVKAAAAALSRVAEMRPEVLTPGDDPLCNALTESMNYFAAIQDKRSSGRPSGFSRLSFALLPGLEIGYYKEELILWLSADRKGQFGTDTILSLFRVLKIDKLAVGETICDDDPSTAYALCLVD